MALGENRAWRAYARNSTFGARGCLGRSTSAEEVAVGVPALEGDGDIDKDPEPEGDSVALLEADTDVDVLAD